MEFMLNIYKAFAAGQRIENESDMEIRSRDKIQRTNEKKLNFLILNTTYLADAVCSGQVACDEK